MRKYILFILLILFTWHISAQESYINENPDRDFFTGKDLFVQEKYAASLNSFENFLDTRGEYAEADMQQEAEYYIACISYELRKDDSQEKLQKYLEQYPYSQFEDRVYMMQGNLAFFTRRYKLAVTYYEKINKHHLSKEEYNDVLFNLGYSYVEKKEYSKAKSQFKVLKQRKSKYKISAIYYASYADYCLENYDDALNGFLTIEESPEFSSFVPYYIVQIYYVKKEYNKLIPYATKIITTNVRNKHNAEIYRILGECYYQKEDYETTIEYMSKYVKGSQKLMRNDMYIMGISYYKTYNFKNAAKYFAKVTTKKDSLAQNAYLHLGNSYIKIQEKNNARMAYRTAAAMDYDLKIKEEAAYNYTLSTLETTTPFGESIKAFEGFLKEFPNSKYKNNIYENLVTAYMSSKNYVAASISLSKLKNLSPEMRDVKAYILFQVGTEQFVKGNLEQAIEIFTNAISEGSSNFENAQVYYWRGESYFRLGKNDKARKDFISFLGKRGAEEMLEYNLANYNIAYTYFNEKDYKQARIMFYKYIASEKEKSTNTYADALDRLADCYFVARDFVNAEKFYSLSIEQGGKNGDYASFQKAFVQGLQKKYKEKVLGLQKLVTDYPKSDYHDDAFYEMGRAFVLLNQQENAIDVYQILINKYPQAPLSRKAAYEIGMLYYNEGQNEHAIKAFKDVIANYPNSEETRTALETLESIFVEQNRVGEFFSYTKTLGGDIVVANPSKEDSLTYIAAERLYMKNNIYDATQSLEGYLQNFCEEDKGHFCVPARYYLAECYYTVDSIDLAFDQYKILATKLGNPYMESVLVRLSQIAYDKRDYTTALSSFKQLQIVAMDADNVTAAKIGILRSSYLVNDTKSTIDIATDILNSRSLDDNLLREARFYKTKALILNNETEKALDDLKILAENLRTENGAESKYLLANYYFIKEDDVQAEKEITDYVKKGTPYQYWLARSFVLLADIYIKRGDDFQAKQYLLSLQENYNKEDTIQDLILERLDQIVLRENNTIIE